MAEARGGMDNARNIILYSPLSRLRLLSPPFSFAPVSLPSTRLPTHRPTPTARRRLRRPLPQVSVALESACPDGNCLVLAALILKPSEITWARTISGHEQPSDCLLPFWSSLPS